MILSIAVATLRGWPLLSCNDASNDCIQDSRRLLGLGLQALARNLLSRGPAAEALVRALFGGIRYRRDQRQLLSGAAAIDLRGLARQGAAGFPLCGQGQPLHHSHEEAAWLRSGGGPVPRSRAAACADAGPAALPAAAEPA